ncbi:hypothetical protein K474DRAFT_1658912 [Panus rudis PR-1116 ss-1]|nr:hypothetical protein K474DRAFT_1658912 [Panus rudis PR-1116 ss-1]
MSSFTWASQHSRRRSHSANPPVSVTRHIDAADRRLKVMKRAHHGSARSASHRDSLSAKHLEMRDGDLLRRGKKARKPQASTRFPFSGVFSFSHPADTDSYPHISSGLPCTSAAFHLFPNRSRRSSRSPRNSPRPADSLVHLDLEPPSPDDVSRLRTDAFYELRRSVAESGEGLVTRMREWESARSSSPSPSENSSRGTKRIMTQSEPGWTSAEDTDDDDIVIVDSRSVSEHSSWGPPRKKRALSLDDMEIDQASVESSLHNTERLPAHTPLSRERNVAQASLLMTPALTNTNTASPRSSTSSLSLPPTHHASSANLSGSSTASLGSPATRSEKAIAALTLALANGACGLNDYSSLLQFQEDPPQAVDESHVGDMWH